MPSSRTAILRWTGRGSLEGLLSSVAYVLGLEGIKASVTKLGNSVALVGPEPIELAALFGNMPGVSWVAVGLEARSLRGLSSAATELAKRYVRKGDRFIVEAEGTAGVLASDIAGIVTTAVLDGAKGSRVSVESPKVRFRAAFDGDRGVVGVEVRRGQGGTPTRSERVACLVSGGTHSSVVAWEAVLQGYSVQLIHVKYSEESLRAVARLYSELSYRADPRGLSLEVLEGESVRSALSRYADAYTGKVFAGFTSNARDADRAHEMQLPQVLSPLYLMPEDRFESEFEGLGVQSFEASQDWERGGEGKPGVRRFAGRRADVSRVLDEMR